MLFKALGFRVTPAVQENHGVSSRRVHDPTIEVLLGVSQNRGYPFWGLPLRGFYSIWVPLIWGIPIS